MQKEAILRKCLKLTTFTVMTPTPTTTAPPTPTPMTSNYANPNAAVDATWLKTNLENENIRIIDTSSSKEGYDIKHIKGALFVDISQDIVDLDNTVSNQVASKEKIQTLLQNLGIKASDTIVVYDTTNNMKAARMFYVLRYYGHKDIRLLNGGLNAWEDAGGSISNQAPEVTPTTYEINDPNQDMITDLAFVNANLDNTDVILVDARPTPQYTAEDVKPGIGRGGGHVPGAINIPGSMTWDSSMKIKSTVDLSKIYDDASVVEDKKVVAYCHNGNLGAYTWFVLSELLGYQDVVLYDGSMLDWSNNPDVPINTGPNP